MLQFKASSTQHAHSAQHHMSLHAWQDLALNIGKLSLAGLFVTGTIWLMGTYA